MFRPKWLRLAVWFVAGLLSLCFLLSLASHLANRAIPAGSTSVGTLSPREKTRLAEALRVRSAFGEAVWPGFAQANIPVLEYNEAYAFLVGYPHPPAGWIKVPDLGPRGQAWQAVAGDAFQGQVYYQQPVADAAGQIGSFTVRIGERWIASMVTKEWGTIELVSQARDSLPSVAKDVVPYRLLLPQVLDSDQYIFKLVHESFHAFQGQQAADRLAQAELAARQYESGYPWDDKTQWQNVAGASGYQPLAELSSDSDFHHYRAFQSKLDAALASPRLLATQRDTRFYSAGMMQAFLLDDLMPDWKSRIFKDGVYLEDLLRRALAVPSS